MNQTIAGTQDNEQQRRPTGIDIDSVKTVIECE